MLKFLPIALTLLLSGCSAIGFVDSVRTDSGDVFINECRFGKADECHFVYKSVRPSILFIYSDAVEHCRQQAAVFNEVAELYGNGIMFWAVEYDEAQSLLSYFPSDGRLPIYLYINQNCAQQYVPEHITCDDMQKHIAQAFGIYSTDKRMQR